MAADENQPQSFIGNGVRKLDHILHIALLQSGDFSGLILRPLLRPTLADAINRLSLTHGDEPGGEMIRRGTAFR